jgi:hypothetical protein
LREPTDYQFLGPIVIKFATTPGNRTFKTQILDYLCSMNAWRSPLLRRFLTVFTGLVFINMSFFLVEMNALELRKKNKVLWENMVKVFAGVNEEEKGGAGELTDTADPLMKEVYLEANALNAITLHFIIVTKPDVHTKGAALRPGVFDIKNPPPEYFA